MTPPWEKYPELLFKYFFHSDSKLCWLWSLVFDFRRWSMRWWKYFRQSRMKADRFWSEIGISQFFLDLLQFRFPMLWGTEPVPFGTRAIQIWTRSIPVSLPEMRKWNQGRNRRMRWRKPSAITNIIILNISDKVLSFRLILSRWFWIFENLKYFKYKVFFKNSSCYIIMSEIVSFDSLTIAFFSI